MSDAPAKSPPPPPPEDDGDPGVPEWMVTFGDMMSLLLTFFIMLVSMSEIKKEDVYREVAESMRRQFGFALVTDPASPGRNKPLSSFFTRRPASGRARKLDTHSGGQTIRAPVGDEPRVESIERDDSQAPSAVVYFDPGEAEFSSESLQRLEQFAELASGKPQRIEIRGHASRIPLPPDSAYADGWDLAYERARNVQRALADLNVEGERCRLLTAGDNEPVADVYDPTELRRNDRVEVYLLRESSPP